MVSSKVDNFARDAIRSVVRFTKTYLKLSRTARRWRMEAPTGHTRKEKKREQVRLKGRRCRIHTGVPPRRGPGRTTHGRRG